MNLGKILTAMVTPFNNQGDIDYNQTSVLIDYLLANGTEGLVIAGTTGESSTLTRNEKINLFKHVVKAVNKRVPVFAGTGSNNTAESIELTKKAEDCGVDGIMLVTPYYNKPSQKGLYEHFSTIADETTLPVMLYNIPGRSAVNMEASTIVELSKLDNIVSLKDATGDFNHVSRIIEETDSDFIVFSGEDGITFPLMSIGVHGVVSVSSHIVGNEMQEMVHLLETGNISEGATIYRKLLPVMNGFFSVPSPTPVKAALKMKGINVGSVRLPLIPLTKEENNKLKAILETI